MHSLVSLHWWLQFLHPGQLRDQGGYWFWSGLGSDFGEATIVAAVLATFRHHNCHVKGCPRIGHYEVKGTPYKVCRKHHPTMNGERITAEHVAAAHDNAD